MRKWAEDEIQILKNAYLKRNGNKNENITIDLARQLNRTVGSIRNKAYELNITSREKYYTDKEILFLQDNYNTMSYEDMAIILKKDAKNIFRKCKQLGLVNKNNCKTKLKERKKVIYTEEKRKKMSEATKNYWKNHEHPKGFQGHKHSLEERNKMSKGIKKSWLNYDKEKLYQRTLKQRATRIKNNTLNPIKDKSNSYSRTKGGKRKDLNDTYFRSSWEANIARYYNYLGIEWEFEPKTFVFENIKRGSVSYTPDFYLPKEDKWVEVKGWMDSKSKTKLKRFEKQYPEEYKKLQLITQKEYEEIKRKVSMFIKGWE